MKRAKTIVIKNPKLRKIRDNLRKILILECVAREEEISARKRKILFDENRNVRLLTIREEEEVLKLSLELRKYMFSFRDSICFCQLCHSTDKDMSYSPRFRKWYCVDCSKALEFSEMCGCIT